MSLYKLKIEVIFHIAAVRWSVISGLLHGFVWVSAPSTFCCLVWHEETFVFVILQWWIDNEYKLCKFWSIDKYLITDLRGFFSMLKSYFSYVRMCFLNFHVNEDKHWHFMLHISYIKRSVSDGIILKSWRVHGDHRRSVSNTYVVIYHFDCLFTSVQKKVWFNSDLHQKSPFPWINMFAKSTNPRENFASSGLITTAKNAQYFCNSLEPWTDKDCQFLQQAKLFFPV